MCKRTPDKVRAAYRSLVKELPLVQALWWFIENAPDSDEDVDVRSELFFALRERVMDGGV